MVTDLHVQVTKEVTEMYIQWIATCTHPFQLPKCFFVSKIQMHKDSSEGTDAVLPENSIR